jgi:ornithine decarboxylase
MEAKDLLNSQYSATYTGPVLVYDTKQLKRNVAEFKQALPMVEINYAVKANPNHEVLRTLMDEGASFEVASLNEVFALEKVDWQRQGQTQQFFDFNRVLYSNPVRPEHYVQRALDKGVKWFVVDNEQEIAKVLRHTKNANFYIRLVVSNHKSHFPLTGKFGVDLHRAKKLVNYCKAYGANLRGVTFHVGSQCTNIDNWIDGIGTATDLFAYMKQVGFRPDFLDLGGGYPIVYDHSVPSIREIGEVLAPELEKLKHFRIVAEPGRYLSANAGHMLCQVISTNVRDGLKWVYLDAGVFHGMTEAAQAPDTFKYNYITEHDSSDTEICAIAGPTCDSLDIVTKVQPLPKGLRDGDFVVIENAGVYTTSYGTDFNGFPAPKMVVV